MRLRWMLEVGRFPGLAAVLILAHCAFGTSPKKFGTGQCRGISTRSSYVERSCS